MKTIRIVLLIAIVLATSLSAMQKQNNEKSLKNLCLNLLAQDAPQAIEFITGNNLPLYLKLELFLKLSEYEIAQYHKTLSEYAATFNPQNNDDQLLKKEINSKLHLTAFSKPQNLIEEGELESLLSPDFCTIV